MIIKNLKNNLKISIITPNFNYSKYIGDTIKSVIYQSYTNFEHIIVDDGSTDNSVEIIVSYHKKYPKNIRLIQQENRGQTYAINVGLKNATGNILGWINSDDLYCEGVFEKVNQTFIQYTDIDAVFGNILIIDNNNNIIKKNKYLKFDYLSGVFNGFGKIISSNAIFWRKELSDEVGFLNEEYEYAMDSEFWSRLLYKKNVKHLNFPFAKFRWHDEAKTIKRRDSNNNEYIKALEEDNKVYIGAYKRLKLSNYLPQELALLLKVLYKIKRLFLKFIFGHYF